MARAGDARPGLVPPISTPGSSMADLDGLGATLPLELRRFLGLYGFAINEITTKLEILRAEYAYLHDRNPIEHLSSRLKDPQGIIDKARRKGIGLGFDEVRATIRDIAGVRVTCSFTSDVYATFEALTAQADVTVVEVEDYIAAPKANGYRSLHAIVLIPVFLSTGVEDVFVELQFRTIAMDFWASLEHKIFYKYGKHVPDHLRQELQEAAETANVLDRRMEALHREMTALDGGPHLRPA